MKITAATAAGSIAIPGFAGQWCRLELSCDDGLTGESLCPAPARDRALTLANELLLGRDPRAVSTLWDVLARHCGQGSAAAARASLDLACWDLAAKSRGEPLWKSLGGSRPRAMAHLSMRDVPESDEAMGRWLDAAGSATAFSAGCLKLSGIAETDSRRLAQMREALRERIRPVDLAADTGRRRPDERLRLLREIERRVDLSWVRVVARAGDELACRRLVDGIRAAVCIGTELAAEGAFMSWLHQRAANVIELDVHRLGITGALRVAEAAFGYELPVILADAPGHVQVHLAPALPSFMSTGIADAGATGAGFSGDLQFAAGRAVMGDRPGAGLEFGDWRSAQGKEQGA